MAVIAKFGRRHFLRGAGGFALAVPFLSSLASRSARAQNARQLRFVAFATDHGGMNPAAMIPAMPEDASTRLLHGATSRIPAHEMRYAPLPWRTVDGWTELSPILRAPSTTLTPSLVEKLNVLTGFDIPLYIGHNRGSFVGNYAANDQGEYVHHLPLPSIDQVIARHPNFEVVAAPERSVNFGINYGVGSDLRFAASATRNGDTVVPLQATSTPRVLWERLFESSGSAGPGTGRTPVVDRVYAHYRDLLGGSFGDAARLSRNDRDRLEEHMQLLSELQRKLALTASCDEQPDPGRPDTAVEALQMAVDLAAAALRCGATNVAVITTQTERLTESTAYTHWHNEVAHDGAGDYDSRTPRFEDIGEAAHSRFFRDIFMRMVTALDVEEDQDGTYLDHSFVYWGTESGDATHDNFTMPVVAAGSANGFFETGRVIDYRNWANPVLRSDRRPHRYPGVIYNRFLANVLQGMGVPPADYGAELARVQPEAVGNGARGYGLAMYHPNNFWTGLDLEAVAWPWSRFETADDLLPGLVRGA